MSDIMNIEDLFPYVKDFEGIDIDKDKKTHDFLNSLGFFLQQALLEINEFTESKYSIERKRNFWHLVLNWDQEIDLGDKIHSIIIKTSNVDNADNFVISFVIMNTDKKVLSEIAKGGFQLNVLRNNEEIYNACINFLLSGIMPDLELFDQKTLSYVQENLFDWVFSIKTV